MISLWLFAILVISQNNPVVDVRDWGVSCSGASADIAILNGHTSTLNSITGMDVQFPPGCIINQGNTAWVIKNQASFKISGVSRSGAAGQGPTFMWSSSNTSGPQIDMECTDAGVIDGLNLLGSSSGSTVGASAGIIIDKNASPCNWNSTDNHIINNTIGWGNAGIANDNWHGVDISPISTNNVEFTTIIGNTFNGSGNQGQAGVVIGNTANAKSQWIEHNNFTSFANAIWFKNGSGNIIHNEFTANVLDVRVDHYSDNIEVAYNTDENSGQFFQANGGSQFVVRLRGNHLGWGAPNTSVFQYDLNTTASSGPTYIISDNSTDSNAEITKYIGASGSGGYYAVIENNSNPNNIATNLANPLLTPNLTTIGTLTAFTQDASGSSFGRGLTDFEASSSNELDVPNGMWLGATCWFTGCANSQFYNSPGLVLSALYTKNGISNYVPYRFVVELSDASGASPATFKLLPPTDPNTGNTYGGALNFDLATNGGTFSVSHLQSGGGVPNRVVCWKADGKTIGYCSTLTNSDGSCTCN